MEFITTGNRIAVENFDIGKIYTITWETGNYKSLACTGKGTDFVMFQDQEPDLLFCLTMDSAITVSSIDEGGGGAGTMNYNELENKPSINGFVLVGNKTGAELGLASQSDLEDYATNASVVAALATKQDALSSSQLSAVNSGITSELVTQIGTNTRAIAGKQDALSSAQLAAVNSGITSTDVEQITTNKNNISTNTNNIASNLIYAASLGVVNMCPTQTKTVNGGFANITLDTEIPAGDYVVYCGNVTSNDTDATTCQVVGMTSTATVVTNYPQMQRGDNSFVTLSAAAPFKLLRLYSSDTAVHGDGDTSTFTDIMLIKKSLWDSGITNFVPYAMSNASITAWILSHS